MNALLRLAVATLVLATLHVCALGLRFAYDSAGLVGLRDVMRAAHRAEELQRWERDTRRRLESRRQVVQELIARRCSLGEALESFRELDREWLDYAAPTSKRLAWTSDEERHCWLLTQQIQDLLAGRPAEAAAALRRLEEDYRQLRAARPAPSAAPPERAARGR